MAGSGDSIRSVELTKRQRNDIFETLVANGVEPESCDLADLTNEPLSVSLPSGPIRPNERWLYERYSHSDSLIRHEPSQSAFTFWPDISRGAERYRAIMAVGSADWGSCSSCDWDQLLESGPPRLSWRQ